MRLPRRGHPGCADPSTFPSCLDPLRSLLLPLGRGASRARRYFSSLRLVPDPTTHSGAANTEAMPIHKESKGSTARDRVSRPLLRSRCTLLLLRHLLSGCSTPPTQGSSGSEI